MRRMLFNLCSYVEQDEKDGEPATVANVVHFEDEFHELESETQSLLILQAVQSLTRSMVQHVASIEFGK